jgi:membrane protease YdiL (CAAX protease family)
MNEDLDQKEEIKYTPPVDEFSLSEIKPAISPVAAAFIGLIGGLFLYQIVGGMITLLIFGLKIENAPVNSVRLMTMAAQVLFILLPALLFTKWFYVDITRVLRVKIPNIKELSLFTLGIIILTPLLENYVLIQTWCIDQLALHYHLINVVKSFLDKMNDFMENTYGNLLKPNSWAEGGLIILIVAIVPALCEETMFRGFIQRSFEFKMKPFWAALITAVFFGLYHFNPYDLIPLIALGFFFGFASYTSNSILVPMFLHFLNNFAAIMMYFIADDKKLLENTHDPNVDLKSAFVILFILLILFIGVIYLIKRFYSQKEMRKNYAGMP